MEELFPIILFNCAIFFWLAMWAFQATKQLTRDKYHSINFVIIAHFFFCGVPAVLDMIFGPPKYPTQPGFWYASRDYMTQAVYTFYVCVCPIIWWKTGKSRSLNTVSAVLRFQVKKVSKGIIFICSVFMFLPFFMAMMSPDPELYLQYGATFQKQAYSSQDFMLWHGTVNIFVKLGIIATLGFLLSVKRIRLTHLGGTLLAYGLAIWIDGKRNIVAVILIMLIYVFWRRGYLRRRRLIVAGIAGMVLLVGFSHLYQRQFRNSTVSDFQRIYQNMRIDYGRDDVIKMSIYAELYPERMRILEYRGQSLLFDLFFYIPRSTWPEKPWPYAVYFTSAMLRMRRARYLGWGMTTSWLDEAVANLGWAGMLAGPLVLSLICRIGDAGRRDLLHFTTLLIGTLLLAVQLSAFMIVFCLWIVLVCHSWYMKGRKRPS